MRYDAYVARAVGEQMIGLLEPSCERIEIMGSLRRGRTQVKDVELLAISKVGGIPDMFGDVTTNYNELGATVDRLIEEGVLAKRPNKRGHFTYGELNKYLIHVPTSVPIDLFATEARNWGMSAVVRTGPANFNKRLMSRFQEMGLKGHAYGGVTRPGPYGREGSEREEIDCPKEEDVFQLAGWDYIRPQERV